MPLKPSCTDQLLYPSHASAQPKVKPPSTLDLGTAGDRVCQDIWKCPVPSELAVTETGGEVVAGRVSTIDIARGGQLGIRVVGGVDTPLMSIMIQQIVDGGAVARDARLRPGDQILEVNGHDLTVCSHSWACRLLCRPGGRLTVYREKPDEHCQIEKQEIIRLNLTKDRGKPVGIQLTNRKDKSGLFIADIVAGSMAALDGRVRLGDQLIQVNGHDLRGADKSHAATLMQTHAHNVLLVVCRPLTSSNQAYFPQQFNYFPFARHKYFDISIVKKPNEGLGMNIAGGRGEHRSMCPIYVKSVNDKGHAAHNRNIQHGDVLLAINDRSLIGLSQDEAVQVLRQAGSHVTLSVMRLSNQKCDAATFTATWKYWICMPRECHSTEQVTLRRAPSGTLGFSIVGGSLTPKARIPVFIKSVTADHVAHSEDSGLRCGDMLVDVQGKAVHGLSHSDVVKLLKNKSRHVQLTIVRWPGTLL